MSVLFILQRLDYLQQNVILGFCTRANEVIGYVDEEPVRAKITGILRGILKVGLSYQII